MLNRSNIVLAVLLTFQFVLLGIALVTSTSSVGRSADPLLPDFSVAAVEQISIADDLGKEVTLARADEGWVLPNADDFPVKGTQVDELLETIAAVDTRRLVATNPANFRRLAVADDDFQRKLSIVSGGKTESLYLGATAGANNSYVRRLGEEKVYQGSGLSSLAASPQASGWIDTSYVNVPQADVVRLTLANENGSFSFLHDGESWSYENLAEDESFEDTRLPSLLRNATSISMVEPLGLSSLDEYGLAEPAVTVEIVHLEMVEVEVESQENTDVEDSGDSEIEVIEHSYTLIFGSKLDDGNVVIKSSSEEYYVSVRESVLNAFREISHEDFAKPMATDVEEVADSGGG